MDVDLASVHVLHQGQHVLRRDVGEHHQVLGARGRLKKEEFNGKERGKLQKKEITSKEMREHLRAPHNRIWLRIN